MRLQRSFRVIKDRTNTYRLQIKHGNIPIWFSRLDGYRGSEEDAMRYYMERMKRYLARLDRKVEVVAIYSEEEIRNANL